MHCRVAGFLLKTYNSERCKQSFLSKLLAKPQTATFIQYKSMADLSWKPPPPCNVGDKLTQIYTPALLVDLDKLDYNLKKMKEMMDKFPSVSVRPHAKAHKCPDMAKLQIQHGSVGLCAQTLVEAEALVYGGGTDDVLVSNQLIGKHKLIRLAALAKRGAKISICVDNEDNIEDLSDVAGEAGVNIDCVVEVNVGQNRCGVEPGKPAVVLAEYVMKCQNLTFKGIQCYQGWNQHIRDPGDRKQAVDLVVDMAKTTLEALESAGIRCPYVTGGGSGTYPYEAGSGVFTEVQPGSYLVMDADYSLNKMEGGRSFTDYDNSMTILTTVQSVSAPDRAVVDAGMKAVSLDSGVPLLQGHPDLTYNCGGDEHGIITPTGQLKVGELVNLIPGHCDPTVNLHDWFVGVRGGVVEKLWSILGRGPGV